MNRQQALEIWTPEGSPWSAWTKAVLFSFLPDDISDIPSPVGSLWRVPTIKEAALIVELADARSVETGISLARSGYRPIPLYNACPSTADAPESGTVGSGGRSRPTAPGSAPSVIEVVSIMRALERETSTLKSIPIASSAPPAFLLDLNRRRPPFPPPAGWFDNRSVVRESDFPTSAFLKEQGIQKIVLIQSELELQSDLRQVLRSWQEGGLKISTQAAAEPWNPQNLTLPKPSLLRTWWDQLGLRFGYRLNSSGSFGHFVHGSGG